MSEKKSITLWSNSQALEEFVLENCQPHYEKLSRCTVDDLNSLLNDLLDSDMDVTEVPLPNGQDFRNAPAGYVIALSILLGEFVKAQNALTGATSSLIHGIRKRREAGERIGRWVTVPKDDLQ
jgi:hypothetical protein